MFVLALTQAEKYWLMYGMYTFALVLLLAAPGQVGADGLPSAASRSLSALAFSSSA